MLKEKKRQPPQHQGRFPGRERSEDVSNEDVAGNRSGILAPEFVPIADATKDLSEYESWSRFCLEQLNVLLEKAAAAGLAVAT